MYKTRKNKCCVCVCFPPPRPGPRQTLWLRGLPSRVHYGLHAMRHGVVWVLVNFLACIYERLKEIYKTLAKCFPIV